VQDVAHVLNKLRRYDIIRLVGEGARGKVYLATERVIRRPVAIKAFSLYGLAGPEDSQDRIMREFFLETRTAGALLHPNIVVIYDVGKKDSLLYIVREFVYGKTILEHQQGDGFSVKKSLEITYELARALEYAHSKGVIHRDIKPENIILSPAGIPKISDFGIARFRKHLKTEKQNLIGSTRFITPEQLLRKEQDHRVDIYQLGVLLFELLTRRMLFKGANAMDTFLKICNESPPPPSRLNPEVPIDVDRIVRRCIERSPDERFARAGELAEALADCLRSGIHPGISPDRELVESLKKFEMFSLFTEREIQIVADVGEFITCPAGLPIIRENDSDSNFFVLLEGKARVVKGSRILSNFLPGTCFGEVGAFARKKRLTAVEAETDCKLLQINALLFQELEPELQLKMLHFVVRNLSNLIIALDRQIMQLTDGGGAGDTGLTVCPLCGFDNHTTIEVCPRCGEIPSASDKSTS
jgi:serine/threonine protein kinase